MRDSFHAETTNFLWDNATNRASCIYMLECLSYVNMTSNSKRAKKTKRWRKKEHTVVHTCRVIRRYTRQWRHTTVNDTYFRWKNPSFQNCRLVDQSVHYCWSHTANHYRCTSAAMPGGCQFPTSPETSPSQHVKKYMPFWYLCFKLLKMFLFTQFYYWC